MLGLAIKNIILVVLVVVLAHYVLKKYTAMKPVETFADKEDLGKFFEPLKPVPKKEEKSKIAEPAIPEEVQHPEKLETCGVPFTVTPVEKQSIKGECAIEQTHPNKYIIVNEYEDENQMNKHEWDGVNLYDEFGSTYSSYMTICEQQRQEQSSK